MNKSIYTNTILLQYKLYYIKCFLFSSVSILLLIRNKQRKKGSSLQRGLNRIKVIRSHHNPIFSPTKRTPKSSYSSNHSLPRQPILILDSYKPIMQMRGTAIQTPPTGQQPPSPSFADQRATENRLQGVRSSLNDPKS